MKIIYDVQEPFRGKVFSSLRSRMIDRWTPAEFLAFVQKNYPGRLGAEVPFEISPGDLLELNSQNYPLKKIAAPVVDTITVRSDAKPDFDHTPAIPADGTSIHTVTVERKKASGDVNNADSYTVIQVRPNQFIPIGAKTLKLRSGVAVFSVGPSEMPGDVSISISDQSSGMRGAAITLRFL